jgi:hypothetical protein
MIVLDENLLGRNLEESISAWYRGSVCFAFPDRRAWEIASSLRTILQHPEFNTKAKRMGRVLRVTDSSVAYYSVERREILEIIL